MKVTLKIKEENTVETRQHEIEELNLIQITRAIKVIKDVMKLAQEDQNLKALFEDIFDAEQEEGLNADNLDQNFIQKLIGAMDVLLAEIPEKAFELLAILSDVEYEVFMQQKPDDVFDIYDAVIQVNDIEKLIKRAKKSLALTKSQVKVINLFNRGNQTEQKQA
ncbi:hypothetical protein [Oceanobacillus sp. Castelsardo]|uniref:hypothetical protein n=1 Tax=Oceanobacillus sp. Castelsardo TaxID=1851204 RepID=UPI00083924F9|nr:hypothetical protein [Oceanobacillus sp. Castelsardo]